MSAVPRPHRCGHPQQCGSCEGITALQQRIPRRPATLRTRAEYRRAARWWELEALRGYVSAADSLRYAKNLRWAAELVLEHGPGTWLEITARACVRNPR